MCCVRLNKIAEFVVLTDPQAQLAAREGMMQEALRTMADDMTHEIEDLRRRLHKYEPPPAPLPE